MKDGIYFINQTSAIHGGLCFLEELVLLLRGFKEMRKMIAGDMK